MCAVVILLTAGKGKGVQKFMTLHDGSGEGTLHTQSASACGGRKYWVWGDDGGDDDKNMDFLSSPGRGTYIEMQESNPFSHPYVCILHILRSRTNKSDSAFATGGSCPNSAADFSVGSLEYT